jgi:hypothetical protein
MYGIDEDRCDELEYNECEENEYRCEDGSCIPEEYWLDGQHDCSDKSDEQTDLTAIDNRRTCPVRSSQFDCDEATAPYNYFACGDGQFELEALFLLQYCYNYRQMLFFCERFWHSSDGLPKWTLENGHCVEEARIQKNLTNMDDSEKCIFYLKCILINDKNDDCDYVIDSFHSLCQNKTIKYPLEPVFKPYIHTIYKLADLDRSSEPQYVSFNGSIKCIGHQTLSKPDFPFLTWNNFEKHYRFDILFCQNFGMTNISDPQIDKHCWHDRKLSFLCKNSLQCISKHRLRNGIGDCTSFEDEISDQEFYMKKQHHLKCFRNSSSFLSLSVSVVGDGKEQCSEGNDEYILELKWDLVNRKCKSPGSEECTVLKSYIQSSSYLPTVENNNVLLFRQYCDTLWHLPKGFDESLCNDWRCPKDEYQCLSGHCILVNQIFDLANMGWHCPDASDDIGLFRIATLSDHNSLLFPLLIFFDLDIIKIFLNSRSSDGYFVPFTAFCNHIKEYGCILANVDDPLNFTINRPCINLTQIGDGTIDCYGGLDERNLLSCGDNMYEQRGFNFHCSNQECIPYNQQCEKRCSNKADSLLCDQLQTLWNSSCEYPTREKSCNFLLYEQCDLLGISKYYCDIDRQSKS